MRMQAPGTRHCIAWLAVGEQESTSVVRIGARANKSAHGVASTCARQRACSMRVNANAEVSETLKRARVFCTSLETYAQHVLPGQWMRLHMQDHEASGRVRADGPARSNASLPALLPLSCGAGLQSMWQANAVYCDVCLHSALFL